MVFKGSSCGGSCNYHHRGRDVCQPDELENDTTSNLCVTKTADQENRIRSQAD